jgi:TetR/AcrR family transcriptional regulator
MARTIEQNRRMRDERRDAILSAALHLFATRGLAATKISDIAAASGASHGLLYHYFPSKDAIYVELIRTAVDGMSAAARALDQMPLSPRGKIEKAVTDLLQMLASNQDFATYFMLTAQASLSTSIPAAAKAVMQRKRRVPYDVIADIMRAGQADGSIRRFDADELAVVFWTMIKGLAMHRAAWGRAFKAPSPRILTNIFFVENRT